MINKKSKLSYLIAKDFDQHIIGPVIESLANEAELGFASCVVIKTNRVVNKGGGIN